MLSFTSEQGITTRDQGTNQSLKEQVNPQKSSCFCKTEHQTSLWDTDSVHKGSALGKAAPLEASLSSDRIALVSAEYKGTNQNWGLKKYLRP